VWIGDSLIGYIYLDLWVESCLVVECKAFGHLLTAEDVGQVLTSIYYPQLERESRQSEPRLQPNLVVFSIRAR